MSSIKTLALCLLVSTTALAATVDDWRGKSIYQVVTDRFATSDDSSAECNTADRKYCGGTWKGIINHLDYVQNLGFDALWISPVVANLEGDTPYGEAYHGYWTRDINSLNSHYGTADDLKALSKALHTRGMYLMVDIVVNHFASLPTGNSTAGDNLTQTFDFTKLSPFSVDTDFHSQCVVDDNNQTSVEQCWLGDKVLPLPDVNTEDPSIVKTINDWINGLVKEYSVDGLRIDTVKHIRKDFWPDFVSAAGTFTLGEIISNDTVYTSGYTDVVDSVFDYPTWFPLVAAFSSPAGNMSALAETATRTQNTYKNGAFLTGSFLENHDQPRFQSITQDQALVKNAMAWPFVHDGIPVLYYGQEQAYAGSSDPSNREALWLTAYATEKPLVAHVKSLNAARRSAIAANKDFLTTAMKFIPQANNATLVVSKPPLLALFTNVGSATAKSSAASWEIPSANGLYAKGEQLVNVLTCVTTQADDQGGLVVPVVNGEPQLLMPASALSKKGALCPSVATGNGAVVGGGAAQNGGVLEKRAGWPAVVSAALAVGFLGLR